MQAFVDSVEGGPPPAGWRQALALFGRPQPVPWPLVALLAIIPFYLFIPALALRGRELHRPELWLDDAFALEPAWSLVYGSLFLAAILPAFVIHRQELLRRTIHAYLAAWIFSFAVFIAYPTAAPAHAKAAGPGFLDWALRTIWGSDVPFNCFPSLHVAQCFLAAFACGRVHRGVGGVAVAWATLVAISTLYTKQHYVADVIAGVLVACAGYAIFLRDYARESTPEPERRLAPVLAAGAFALYGLFLVLFAILHALGSG